MLAGSDSVPVVAEATTLAAAAIPHVQIHVLEGHGHFAHRTDPALVTEIVIGFTAPCPLVDQRQGVAEPRTPKGGARLN